MSNTPNYSDYAADSSHFVRYERHQSRYRQAPRESDKVLVSMLERAAPVDGPLRILDAGCSNGNLLYHVGQSTLGPRALLEGFDYSHDAVARCHADPDLQNGISIFHGDITNPPCPEGAYDFIFVNAVFYCLDDSSFQKALQALGRLLKPGGMVLNFELVTDFPEYSLELVERSPAFPEGHTLRIRGRHEVEAACATAGMRLAEFTPFEIPIDLALEYHPDWLTTYTVPTQDGRRLMFRGCLFQPWAFLMLQKAG